jgi:hypothetical protein
MPGVSELQEQALMDELSPETSPLYLPSSAPLDLRSSMASLVDKETRIRHRQKTHS